MTHIKRHFFVFISNSYFLCVSNSMFLFLSFVFFHRNKQNAFEKNKSNRIERKKRRLLNFAITLQNSGGKYTYGPPNFIYARKKDIKCATSPSKWVIIEIKNISLKLYSSPQQQQALFLRIHFLLILGFSHKFSYFSRKTKT